MQKIAPSKTAAAAAAICIALAGCATTFSVQDVAPVGISANNALKLTDYPANRDYKSMGTIRIHAYRAGLSQPTPDDVWTEISRAVASKGGNACVLRGSEPDDIFQRQIWVTCEVLAVSDVRSAPATLGTSGAAVTLQTSPQPIAATNHPAASPARPYRPASCDLYNVKPSVGGC